MWDKIRWIWAIWRPLRGWFWLLMLLTVISTAVALAFPLAFKVLLDALQASLEGDAPDAELMVERAIWLLILIGVLRVAARFYPATRAHLNYRIEQQVRDDYFQRILKKGYRFFHRFRTGDLVTRLTDDLSGYPKIAWFCCSGIFRAVNSTSQFVFCLAVMLYLDWRLALLSVAPLPLMLVAFVMIHHRLGRKVELNRRAVSETNELLESAFSGIEIVKAFGAQERQADGLHQQLDRRIEAEMGVVHMWQLIHSFYNGLNAAGQIIVVGYGGLLVIRGQMTAGTFYAFYTYLGMLVGPLLDIPNLFVTARQAFVSIDRVEEIRSAPEGQEGHLVSGDRPLDRFESLELQRVSFRYPSRSATDNSDASEVLSEVDLAIARGERVALMGRLGSGKSTLLHLAAGMAAPQQGEVLLNQAPLTETSAADFGRRVGLVEQDPVLFGGTLKENLVFGREEDGQRLNRVLDAVGMTGEVAAMPDGPDQLLGLHGMTLSGGQRQRVSIARALYGQPQLLLLDDLTSALDAENEERLWDALDEVAPEVAMLVVTHRLATARRMDRIGLLEEGRLVAVGTHSELLKEAPAYRAFIEGDGD